MKRIIASAYGAVVALLVAVAHDQLFTRILTWPKSASLAGAIAVGVLGLFCYELVVGSKTVAKRLSPISKVEGAWRITLTNNPERPQSVCKICFTHRVHVYAGYGINRDETIGSTWSSRDLHYDADQDELSFTADAINTTSGRRIRNYGYIRFSKNANGTFEYGNGYFVDLGDELTQNHMTLIRIEDGEYDEIVKTLFDKTRAVVEAPVQQVVEPERGLPLH